MGGIMFDERRSASLFALGVGERKRSALDAGYVDMNLAIADSAERQVRVSGASLDNSIC